MRGEGKISVSRLRDLLILDEVSGSLVWRHRCEVEFKTARAMASWNARYAGKQAGSATNGYLQLSVDDVSLRYHRVVWAMAYGQWPLLDIDHINHDRRDNRLENLRSVSRAENNRNHGPHRRATIGAPGVRKTRQGNWSASIGFGKNRRYLGRFATIEAASEAAAKARLEMGFHQNHGVAPEAETAALRALLGAVDRTGTGGER